MKASFHALLAVLLPLCLVGQPGTLDPTFGTGGVATFTLTEGWVAATDIVPMPDGDALVVSIAVDAQNISRMLLMKLDPNGALDNTFGQGGMLRWSPGALGMRAQSTKLLPDGKLLVCGNMITGNQLGVAALYRFNADGTPDATFGSQGMTTIAHTGGNDNLYDMTILGNGQVLCVGEWKDATAGSLLVARFNADGTLDSTFGTNGMLTHDMFPGTPERAMSIHPASDGNYHINCNRNYNAVFVLGMLPTGQVNAAYGSSGIVALNAVNMYNNTRNAARRPDGTLIVTEIDDQDHVKLYALDNNGDLVTGFGNNGSIVPDAAPVLHWLNRLVALPDGTLIGSGGMNDASPGYKSMFTRYTTTGALDAGFGNGGSLLLPYFMFPGSYALTMLPNGKIMTVVNNSSTSPQAVAHVLQLNGPAVGIAELDAQRNGLACGSSSGATFVELPADGTTISGAAFHDVTGKLVAQVQGIQAAQGMGRTLPITYPAALEPGCYVLRLIDRQGRPIGSCAVVKGQE
ncbi:MAG: hypothetical protein JNL05_04275 [Flavobacteriales bacterium]|nr:hypothetical protein [Flavobacteriales bacterium]